MEADGGDRGDAEKRIQAILAALIKQRLRVSLERVEAALGRWRQGELGPFEAHAEVLAHVARADHLADVMSKTVGSAPPRSCAPRSTPAW